MSHILVTGANGFVGKALCAALSEAGHGVRAAQRLPHKTFFPDGVKSVAIPDIGPGTRWDEALEGIDIIVHLAARVHVIDEAAKDPLAAFRRVNADGTRILAEAAAKAGVRRLVYLSSIKVNGEETGAEPFSEETPPNPKDPYGVSKWEAEQSLAAQKSALETVVLRPPLVYGEGAKGNMGTLFKICRLAPPLPLGGIKNRRSLIYLGNLIDAIIVCLDHPVAANKTYLLCDGEDVSTPELIRRIAAAMGRPARLFPVPKTVLQLAGALIGKSAAIERLSGSLRIDGAAIRKELCWTPPFTMVQGLRRTVDSFLSGNSDEILSK